MNTLSPLLDHPLVRQPEAGQPAPAGFIEVTDPSRGEVLAWVKQLDAADVEEAIQRAQRAQQSWKQQTAQTRADILLNWYQAILAEREALANILTAEQGKPLAEARGEIGYAASFIRWFAEEARRVEGDVLTPPQAHQRLLVLKQPVGVCAAITPWNFPAAMITRKAAPALAAGCAMIVKPAEQTPLTAFALENLARRAGLPDDLLIHVLGDAVAVGKTLCASPVIRKLSFTGSTEVGRLLMAQCAPTVKKLSLELGGNAPFLVFDDADPAAAVQGIMASKFRNSGQTCVCANRIYVQRGIYPEIVRHLTTAVAQLKVGDGRDAESSQGPLIDEAAVAKVQLHIDDACQQGAEVVSGGQPHALGGTFFQPTILTGVTPSMRVAHEETFGPLAALIPFDTEEEAIRYANDSEFGLAAYFYTRDASRQWRVSEALESGMVGVNTGAISNEVAPFGGVKQSGLGREGSRYGLDEYLEMKYLCFDISQ
ncbi:NAD-dependent succinate-semialdehyde dehydrogenase [Nissabacter sp. SGAir0207]|uniref:NAD-dependent succinate-semialdehyde dehydrogenase n=1 Tax=Nissabacter sp. SGAir0207 TaxID=2126321 RepID=UPI0010CD43C7|nr:NAD-dependent succinate-semialdehyde dehydrogenase [Nissabacter sp. SGAir0207]QCR37410.1 succinate-semialdehyde dehydrogenase (NADP(+)) [Nissabacter sp. SGAir0207]